MQPDGTISTAQLQPPGIVPSYLQFVTFNSTVSVSELLDELGAHQMNTDSKL